MLNDQLTEALALHGQAEKQWAEAERLLTASHEDIRGLQERVKLLEASELARRVQVGIVRPISPYPDTNCILLRAALLTHCLSTYSRNTSSHNLLTNPLNTLMHITVSYCRWWRKSIAKRPDS